jgi:hypothetical protein
MDKELNKILKETGNRNPFTVPENYFENFAADIDAKIASDKLTAKRLLKPWFYMAAMFVGLFIMGHAFYAVYQNSRKMDADLYEMYVMSQIDQTVVLDYYPIEANRNE